MNKFAIVCSGQGSLSPNLFEFAKNCKESVSIINKFSERFNWDMFSVGKEGEIDIRLNYYSQPLTIVTSLANWEALKNDLPAPGIIAGYSAGEVAAWGCSGGIDINSLTLLSKLRCEAMEKFSPSESGMLAIKGLDKDSLLKFLSGKSAYLAIINELDHFIIGGLNSELSNLERIFQSSGIWCKRLLVSVPSHTPLLKDATNYLRDHTACLKNYDSYSKIPVIQGINGLITSDFNSGVDSLINAVSSTIDWQSCMQSFLDYGVRVVLELGPGSALSKIISEVHPQISARSVSEFRSVSGVKNWILRELEA